MMDVWSSGTVLRRTVCAVGQRSCKITRNGGNSKCNNFCASVVDPSIVQGVGAVYSSMWLCNVHQNQEIHIVKKKTRTCSTLIVVPRAMYV